MHASLCAFHCGSSGAGLDCAAFAFARKDSCNRDCFRAFDSLCSDASVSGGKLEPSRVPVIPFPLFWAVCGTISDFDSIILTSLSLLSPE